MRVRQPATHFPPCDRYSWLVHAGSAADADWSLVGLTPVVTKTVRSVVVGSNLISGIFFFLCKWHLFTRPAAFVSVSLSWYLDFRTTPIPLHFSSYLAFHQEQGLVDSAGEKALQMMSRTKKKKRLKLEDHHHWFLLLFFFVLFKTCMQYHSRHKDDRKDFRWHSTASK